MTTALLELLAQPLALLGREARPALTPHALAPVAVPAAPAAQAPEQNPAEQEQADGLPVLELRAAEQRRDQPVPQAHHHEAQDRDGDHRQRHERGTLHHPTTSTSHDVLLASTTDSLSTTHPFRSSIHSLDREPSSRPRRLAAAPADRAPRSACARAAC